MGRGNRGDRGVVGLRRCGDEDVWTDVMESVRGWRECEERRDGRDTGTQRTK